MDIDVTILFQLGLFLVLLVGLNGFLFRPFQKVIEARQQKLLGQKLEVERLLHDAAADLEVYQGRMREARDLAQRERETLIASGREEERRLIAEVRADITKAVGDARKEVQAAEAVAQKALASESEQLARRMVEKVLVREVGV